MCVNKPNLCLSLDWSTQEIVRLSLYHSRPFVCCGVTTQGKRGCDDPRADRR